jgi:plastocyanin
MHSKEISILIILLVVIFGGWYTLDGAKTLRHNGAALSAGAAVLGATTATDIPVATSTVSGVTVMYTDQGFSPKSVTVKQGESVTWIDERANPMWVASNPHPVHTGYDGTSLSVHCASDYTGSTPFDQCAPGTAYSFIFNKTGTWGYHDHLNHAMAGTVVVTP